MDWLKKHADTVVVIGVVLAGFWNLSEKIYQLNDKITDVDKRISIVETILMMQNKPCAMAKIDENK